jgi:hypothetical protein
MAATLKSTAAMCIAAGVLSVLAVVVCAVRLARPPGPTGLWNRASALVSAVAAAAALNGVVVLFSSDAVNVAQWRAAEWPSVADVDGAVVREVGMGTFVVLLSAFVSTMVAVLTCCIGQ